MARFLISKSGVSGSIIKRDESEWSLLALDDLDNWAQHWGEQVLEGPNPRLRDD